MQTTDNLPRMRVAREIYDLLRQADPQSRVSMRTIRLMASSGQVPTVRAGNRVLINYDAIISLLNSNIPAPAPQIGVIRPIQERQG